MKSLKQLGKIAVLTLVLSTSTFAGIITTGRTDPPPPPPATSSSEGIITTGITGTGQTSSDATLNSSSMEIMLTLLQTVLAGF
jgi:hypothetical protein